MEEHREIEEFWQQKEQALGEAILRKSISRTLAPELPETFGLLYASESLLVYEYTKGGRKSILELLFARRGQSGSTETVSLQRSQIRRVALVNAATGKGWVRRSLGAAEVLRQLEQSRPRPVWDFLAGTFLCVCTHSSFLLLDTPSNREWLRLLRGESGAAGG
jgi:hypothetical protein